MDGLVPHACQRKLFTHHKGLDKWIFQGMLKLKGEEGLILPIHIAHSM